MLNEDKQITAQQILESIDFEWIKQSKQYSIPAYKQQVLNVLVPGWQNHMDCSQHVDTFFDAIGLVANNERSGRKYVPAMIISNRVKEDNHGGWTTGGDFDGGSTIETLPDVDFTSIIDAGFVKEDLR